MQINRTCKVCPNKFSAIKVTQFFCSRKCFKKDYYLRTKSKIEDRIQNPTYPIKQCSFCETSSQLSFDPVESPQLFNAWGCPHCGATNRLVWQYGEKANSYQMLKSILITFHSNSVNSERIEPQPYRLPVMRPEHGNAKIVVMTCDIINIVDIQRNNRKKILFS